MNCSEFWNALIQFSKFIKCLGGLTLGVGTLFLGLAAFYKSSEIYEVVQEIKSLEDVSKEIKRNTSASNRLITAMAKMLSEKSPKNKRELEKILSENLSAEPHFNYLVKQSETDKIIGHWSSLSSDKEREDYLIDIFKSKILKQSNKNEYINGTTID